MRLRIDRHFRALLAVLAVTCLLGFGFKQHCMPGGWTDSEQYLTGCYSDAVPFWTARAVDKGSVPYLQTPIEYPVLTGAATGEGTVPADLLGKLLGQVGRLQRHVLSPRGMMFNGLAPREVEVLRLLADGFDTQDIAKELCYSERTVKNVVHDVTSRLQLRNRSHAVAYALREGLI